MHSKVIAAAALLLLNGACALLPDKDKTPQAAERVGDPQARPQASIETKQLAAEKEAELTAEVIFKKGQATLSAAERARLADIMKRLKDKDKVGRVIVAAWADQALPGENAEPLPQAARDLAEARGKSLRDLLETQGGKNLALEFHNMAEKPGVFAKFISSVDARIKKSLEGARPSKAIVLLLNKE